MSMIKENGFLASQKGKNQGQKLTVIETFLDVVLAFFQTKETLALHQVRVPMQMEKQTLQLTSAV